MCDDLTNPDILEALEIAKVEWRGFGGFIYGLRTDQGEITVCVKDASGSWCFTDDATPADLDHALAEWLTRWLPQHMDSFSYFRWVVTELYCLPEGVTAVAHVAKYVVKLKPKAEENEDESKECFGKAH